MQNAHFVDPFEAVQQATRSHRSQHGCGAYTYSDGSLPGVVAAAAGARKIVEVGTALGYSALWLAHGAPLARVDTIELDPLHVQLAREQIAGHAEGARITVHEGTAEAILPTLDAGTYDVAFFDGFTPTATLIGGLRRLLRDGGTLVAGNLTLGPESALLADLSDPARWLTHSLGETALAVKRAI